MELANPNYRNIWKLLAKYICHIDISKDSDLICCLCKSLLVNAHQTICGCVFCLECFTNYSMGDEKYCPGNVVNGCMELMVNIGKCLQVDHATNRKVSNVLVNCPIQLCQSQVKLKYFEKHMESHMVECPYSDIGCEELVGRGKEIADNLVNDNHKHASLLVQLVDELRREIASVRDESKNNSAKETAIEDIRNEVGELRRQNDLLKEEIMILKQDMAHGRNMKSLESGVLSSIDNHCKTSITPKRPHVKKDNSLKQNDSSSERHEMKENVKSSSLNRNLHPITENLLFEWRIANFTQKVVNAKHGSDTKIYSEPFFTHKAGYKLCLCLSPNGNGLGNDTHLSVYFCLMRSHYDDHLTWPMPLKITISIVDQSCSTAHTTRSFDYESTSSKWRSLFDKPVVDRSCGFGKAFFIQLNELFGNSRLVQGDSIVLRCSVHT